MHPVKSSTTTVSVSASVEATVDAVAAGLEREPVSALSTPAKSTTKASKGRGRSATVAPQTTAAAPVPVTPPAASKAQAPRTAQKRRASGNK